MQYILEAKALSKIYKSKSAEVRAVDAIDLQIARGDYVAIMGPSGSGKSTLMQILGLLDRATSGSLKILGREVTSLNDAQLAKLRSQQIGFIFQFFNLLGRTTALDNVALPMLYSHQGKNLEKAKTLLRKVNLSDRMHHTPQELSGGQQQRVAIARSMANDPQILMCDEPTGNVSTQQAAEIMNMVAELHAQGVTIILITHEPEVAKCASRVIYVRDGKIIKDERTQPAPALATTEATPEIFLKPHKRFYAPMLLENMRMGVRALRANVVRTFLTMLGVIIGVAAVIAMVAISTGASESIKESLSRLGTNLFAIRAQSSRAISLGQAKPLKLEDAKAILKLKNAGYPINDVGAQIFGGGQIKYQGQNWSAQVLGVLSNYQTINNAQVELGAFLSSAHDTAPERVSVLGQSVVKTLFAPGINPVGSVIKINGNDYRVLGVLKPRGGGGMGDPDNVVIVPLTTAQKRIFGRTDISLIDVEASSAESLAPLMGDVEQFMRKRHGLRPGQDNDFNIINYAEIQAALNQTVQTFGLLLGSVAIVSLLVGGIGIMNIMLVSVKERTREIGLRKALGATSFDILFQFMIEALVVSLIGGILGILLGSGVAFAIATLAGWPVGIKLEAILISVSFSMAIGLIFGIWPAKQASNLSPIEALEE
jgi:macrolide transport system ATP-binding/permease protein